MIACSYLRIFHPLETFGDEERAHWERFILSGGPPRPARPVYRDESPAGRGHVGVLAPDVGEHADIRLVDGRYYVCPWRTRLRVLASILSLHETEPGDIADSFVTEAEARRAARELARLRRQQPSAVPSILESPWHVPIRWFVLVDDDERQLLQAEAGAFRLFYWTPIEKAQTRAARAARTLRQAGLEPVSELIEELQQWIAAVHPSACLELDYGSVSSLFTWDELDDDHSARQIQLAIAALEEPDGLARAGELYDAVTGRWAEARGRESLN